jgi:hypothetical protein
VLQKLFGLLSHIKYQAELLLVVEVIGLGLLLPDDLSLMLLVSLDSDIGQLVFYLTYEECGTLLSVNKFLPKLINHFGQIFLMLLVSFDSNDIACLRGGIRLVLLDKFNRLLTSPQIQVRGHNLVERLLKYELRVGIQVHIILFESIHETF